MTTPRLHVLAVVHEGRATVTLVGELDLDTAPRLSDAVAACLDEQPDRLSIDLADVGFCDCAGLNALLEARAEAHRIGVRMRLEGAGPQMTRLFALTGTSELFAENGNGRMSCSRAGEASRQPPSYRRSRRSP